MLQSTHVKLVPTTYGSSSLDSCSYGSLSKINAALIENKVDYLAKILEFRRLAISIGTALKGIAAAACT